MSDWRQREARRDAYPKTDLMVGPDGAHVVCPYCDESPIYLHLSHECHNCGASFDIDVRWSR